jgi:hypothetical protein
MRIRFSQSGNPSGRPTLTAEELKLATACRENGRDALGTIVNLMKTAEKESVRLAAAQYILNRGWGKAVQAMEVTGKTASPWK